MNEQIMSDRDHLEAVCVEAACVELRGEELAEVSGGIFDFSHTMMAIDGHQH
jgi:hypothetical protein